VAAGWVLVLGMTRAGAAGKLVLAGAASSIALMPGATATYAAAPITLVPSIHSGWQVDGTSGANLCTAASKDRCQTGRPSGAAGGFKYLTSVAVDPGTGRLYVADTANSRIQEFSADGAFLAMFGWDVNRTADGQVPATQAQKNLCTAASGEACTAGVRGTVAGQLASPSSVSVDPHTGDVYVSEIDVGDFRVDRYTSDGHFVWTVGAGVNRTTHGNLCSAREIERSRVKCGPGAENPSDSGEHGAFKFAQTYGDLLAAGGPEDVLYVGDEHRVQEFDRDGKWKREILLVSLSAARESNVVALTLDESGNLYLVYRVISGSGEAQGGVVRKFNPGGEQVAEIVVQAKQPQASVDINGLAIDSSGRLAVIGDENLPNSFARLGALYDTATARRIADFTGPSDNDGIAFNRAGDLYIAATDDQEVDAYVPAPVTELVTSPVACEIGHGDDRAARFNCALTVG
jgi:DNA-binding beta-propeller fold protein YncE